MNSNLGNFKSEKFSGGDVDSVDGVSNDGDGGIFSDDSGVERR